MTNLNELIYNWSFALFDLARNETNLNAIANEAAKIVKIIKKNKNYLSLLNSYEINDEDKFNLVNQTFGKFHIYIVNTIKLAIRQHTIKYLISILNKFVELANEKMNIKYGIIFTTYPLENKDIKKFEIKLSKKLNADIHLTNEIDEKLIGGIKIKIDDFLIDNSFFGKLQKMRKLVN
ncbi:F0F1 ATP synthase subunit delta [Metamycoplasma equirhinis]|uniref:F0F1 ATP synthase subunit delta n=1 Tax=Metamycoplasma equirhinis TaxID=92402 RepID=UPI003593B44B